MNNKYIGELGEETVARILKNKGFRIIARNFGVHNVGEIDIAAVNDDKLLIVEVKTRHKRNVGKNYPIENSVGYKKRFKVKKTADYLIEKYKLYNLNIYFLSAFVTYNSGGLIQNVEFESFL